MSNGMEQAYAQALWSSIEKGIDARKAVAALRTHLANTNRLRLLPKIGRAFGRLAARQWRKNTMTLRVARQKDAAHALREAKKVLDEQNIEETDLSEGIDETLIGGWRLEGRGLLVDRSWKKALVSIYERATG